MDTLPPSFKWCRLRFSLRAMFVAVAVICVWLSWNINFIQRRKAVLAEIHERQKEIPALQSIGGTIVVFESVQEMNDHPPRIPTIRSWLGDRPIPFVTVLFKTEADSLKSLFPESRIEYVANPDNAKWLTEHRDWPRPHYRGGAH